MFEQHPKFRRRFSMGRPFSEKNGWAWKSEGKWFAVYYSDDELWFRCDELAYRIDSSHKCAFSEISNRHVFILTANDLIVFRHEYKIAQFARKIDPTYDEIDAESDDFLLWLHRLWNDGERIKALIGVLSKSPHTHNAQSPVTTPAINPVAFQIGDTVGFTDKYFREQVGTIIRLNDKTVSIDCNGQRWRVSPKLLRRIIDL
jgi:hypothetical protein